MHRSGTGVSRSGCGAFAPLRLVTAKRSLLDRGFLLPEFECFQSRDYAIQLLLSRMQLLEHPEHALLQRVHMAIIDRSREFKLQRKLAKCLKNDGVTGRPAPLYRVRLTVEG